MSTFYVLPPRPLLARHVCGLLHSVLPGLNWDPAVTSQLPDLVSGAAGSHPGVYVVYREDLPAGEPPERALADGFGAEAGDEVVEVRAGAGPGKLVARRWRVGAA
jgi:hypothetical protein